MDKNNIIGTWKVKQNCVIGTKYIRKKIISILDTYAVARLSNRF